MSAVVEGARLHVGGSAPGEVPERPPSTGTPSGTIDDVLGSEEIEIYSFHRARSEAHVSKLQKQQRHRQTAPSLSLRMKKSPTCFQLPRGSSEITDTLVDYVWVLGEDDQSFHASTIVRPPLGVMPWDRYLRSYTLTPVESFAPLPAVSWEIAR